jgi:putative Ca2+/H+ antiporter (TMEM165/GDT1 family)
MIFNESLTAILTSFSLISLAEIGDKSQLVCMTLAARYRPLPVLFGASAAFMLLNILAVVFGAGIAAWLPETVLAALVAILFGAFGLHALFVQAQQEDDNLEEKNVHNIFITTFVLLLAAEFGDKTQLAVAGLAGSMGAVNVWIGATIALIFISALGVWAGKIIIKKLSMNLLHKLSGSFFLLFALAAAWQVFA